VVFNAGGNEILYGGCIPSFGAAGNEFHNGLLVLNELSAITGNN
jgi:hypothetical protein